MNVPIELIKIVNSYLTKRKFKVVHDGHESSLRDIVAGVPQGSVLGPLLFLVFINDIPNNEDNTIALFADDTAVIANSGSHKLLEHKINEHYGMLSSYFHKWKIKINSNKTELLLVNHNRKKITLKLTNNNLNIVSQNEAKYLGVIIDSKLSFTKHIAAAVNEAKAAMCMLYELIKNKNVKIKNKILIYKTCIRPILTYAFPI